jgi:hypothetical protein
MKTCPILLYNSLTEHRGNVHFEYLWYSNKRVITRCIVELEHEFYSSDLYADVQVAIAIYLDVSIEMVSIPCEILIEVKSKQQAA